MSITSALARIQRIVEDARPIVFGLGLGDRFVFDEKGSEVRSGGAGRRFWIQALEGGGVAPSSAFSRRRRVTCALVVEYPNQQAQPQQQDRAVVEDYDVINAALFDGTKWARATSGIVAISADGEELIGPYTIERSSAGWRLRIAFVLEYEASAAAVGARVVRFGTSSTTIDTEAEIKALLTAADATAHVEFSVDAAAGAFVWYVAPVAFGPAEFTVSGFIGGFDLVVVTDVDGTPCNVYRSTYASLGAIDVEVARV